jgi:hypothetical protein
MSCWWDLDFSVAGPEPFIDQLRAALPHSKFDDGARLFHHVEIVSSIAGFIVIHASRNYHGAEAICELIARFPDLVFQGSLHADNGHDHYTLFHGRSGETTTQDLVIPDFEERLARCPDRAEIEDQMAGLDRRIACFESEREHLKELLLRPGNDADAFSPGAAPTAGEQISR